MLEQPQPHGFAFVGQVSEVYERESDVVNILHIDPTYTCLGISVFIFIFAGVHWPFPQHCNTIIVI